ATDGVGQVWETQDDDNTVQERLAEAGRSKTYRLPVEEYVNWINNLEKSGLSYIKHDHRGQIGLRKKNEWSERWYCHRYGTYESTAGKDATKKPRLVQKESKKCECKSYIHVILPISSTTVVLRHYYKHLNHYPGQLSDLCTLPLSENIRQYIWQRALEELDAFSIQQLLRFREIELQNQVQLLENNQTEIVLRDLEVSVFVNELKIGRMNPQRCQQRIHEIVGATKINLNDIYSIRPDIWIVYSMTNDDVENSVRRKDSELRANANSVEDSSHNYFIQQLESPVAEEPNNFFYLFCPLGDKNFEFTKLQEELTQAIQVEITKIARINVVDSSNESERPNIAPNSGIRKQNRY
ncbi:hypothetical protein C2G38_2226462, partial [Gigaspora rosea]